MVRILFPAAGMEIPAYLAVPSSTRPVAGVVVLHDAGGMSQDMINQAGGDGFPAAVPELYCQGGFVRCISTIMRDCIARRGQSFDGIES